MSANLCQLGAVFLTLHTPTGVSEPPTPPHINGYETRQILHKGDHLGLECGTSNGGFPSFVRSFECGDNAVGVKEENGTSLIISFGSIQPDHDGVECVCTANWTVSQNGYEAVLSLKSSVTLRVGATNDYINKKDPEKTTDWKSKTAISTEPSSADPLSTDRSSGPYTRVNSTVVVQAEHGTFSPNQTSSGDKTLDMESSPVTPPVGDTNDNSRDEDGFELRVNGPTSNCRQLRLSEIVIHADSRDDAPQSTSFLNVGEGDGHVMNDARRDFSDGPHHDIATMGTPHKHTAAVKATHEYENRVIGSLSPQTKPSFPDPEETRIDHGAITTTDQNNPDGDYARFIVSEEDATDAKETNEKHNSQPLPSSHLHTGCIYENYTIPEASTCGMPEYPSEMTQDTGDAMQAVEDRDTSSDDGEYLEPMDAPPCDSYRHPPAPHLVGRSSKHGTYLTPAVQPDTPISTTGPPALSNQGGTDLTSEDDLARSARSDGNHALRPGEASGPQRNSGEKKYSRPVRMGVSGMPGFGRVPHLVYDGRQTPS